MQTQQKQSLPQRAYNASVRQPVDTTGGPQRNILKLVKIKRDTYQLRLGSRNRNCRPVPASFQNQKRSCPSDTSSSPQLYGLSLFDQILPSDDVSDSQLYGRTGRVRAVPPPPKHSEGVMDKKTPFNTTDSH